jgi:hypothetical protein
MTRVGPTKFFGAEPATDGTTVRLPDGREMLDVNVIMDEDSVEQIRTGYKCIRCHEPQSLSDEAERLAEIDAYEQKHGIVLPPSVKFPNGPI